MINETSLTPNLEIKMLSSTLKGIRYVGGQLVADPVQVKEPEMKAGGTKDFQITSNDKELNFSRRMCVVADTAGSIPYEIDKKIKDAICGDVYIGFQLELIENDKFKRNDLVVIKIINMQKVAQLKRQGKLQEDPMKEIAILQMFQATTNNVCTQVDCIRDDKYIYSIMRHYGEELFNCAGKLSEDECRHYFRQIVHGVEYLQSFNVCHRDLSLENILISTSGECTIIDFGMALIYPTDKASTLHSTLQVLSSNDPSQSKVYDENSDENKIVLMTAQGACGKRNYIAPEILANYESFNGAMVDNWALGVILFMLLTGRPPFHKASQLDRWYRMCNQGQLREMLKLWKVENLSESSIDLLQKLLKGHNHVTRQSASDILNDPWLASASMDM